ncbi:uncharacterized protein LOC114376292 [Glycine soja]|uniref:EF-hand domain-containing protein n=1 Tax=Glycine soja TaxID=3848 RepID=A0A445LRJ5_GLYSO|nr:uncharacterized protein LOC114376292 [Glycine soja]RZC25949.1 hypothetical protein D0Y65_004576 [Glycine soja]
MCTALERNGMGGCAAIGVEVFMACSGSNVNAELVEDAGWVELQGICCLLVRLQSPATFHHKIESKQVYDSDCNGKVTFHDMLRALRDLSGPFMSDQQREEVLTQVLEEAGYAKDCSLVLSDFMKILGNSGLKMEVEVPVD